MENLILITELNDFIFCPASIYFHKVYSGVNELLYHEKSQIAGKNVHKSIDKNKVKKLGIVTNIDVYSERFGLIGKIDIYDKNKKILIERKKKVKKIYDGYIFQLYAQYYCMKEMGYEINSLEIYSVDDNKKYYIDMPENNVNMDNKLKKLISDIYNFNLNSFRQTNKTKCENCIYSSACDRSLNVD